jgi:hypothetical protein
MRLHGEKKAFSPGDQAGRSLALSRENWALVFELAVHRESDVASGTVQAGSSSAGWSPTGAPGSKNLKWPEESRELMGVEMTPSRTRRDAAGSFARS